MANYAQISGKSVVNVVVADNKEEAEAVLGATLVEITEENSASIGYEYDAETGLFTNPFTVEPEEPIEVAE